MFYGVVRKLVKELYTVSFHKVRAERQKDRVGTLTDKESLRDQGKSPLLITARPRVYTNDDNPIETNIHISLFTGGGRNEDETREMGGSIG